MAQSDQHAALAAGTPRISRRAAVGGMGAAGVIAAGVTVGASSAAAVSRTARTGAAFLRSGVQPHALRRLAYGADRASTADMGRLGIRRWVDWQLQPDRIPDTAADRVIALLGMPAQSTPVWHVRSLINSGSLNGYSHLMSVPTSHVIRSVWGRRSLQTVMEEFWADLLHVAVPSDDIDDSRANYQYTLRRFAFGRFSDLLWNATRHPAMLTFLDNRSSTAAAPNENHGRELLELHTVGVDAGYTEAHIKSSARILSGLSVNSESGDYEYKPWRHATGAVRVLGFAESNPSQEGGEAVAARYIAYLARHPATARRIATRLCVRFVSDPAPPALVNALVRTYLAQGTNIKPVLRQLFSSAEFRRARGTRVRRPIEHIAATVRLLDYPAPTRVGDVDTLTYHLGRMGQAPFRWPAPNGYPDADGAWLSTATTLARWNSTLAIVNGWGLDGILRPDLRTWLYGSTLPAYHGGLVDAAARRLLGRTLPAGHRAAILTYLGVSPWTPVTPTSAAVDWRLRTWISLLLDSPYTLYR